MRSGASPLNKPENYNYKLLRAAGACACRPICFSMPIYAYKCSHCGFAKDVLQKMSDAPLKVCPSCGQPAFVKQVTAAGFQLKGSGWYVTDFRNEGKADASSAPASDAPSSGAAAGASSGTSGDAAAASSVAASPGSAAAAD